MRLLDFIVLLRVIIACIYAKDTFNKPKKYKVSK